MQSAMTLWRIIACYEGCGMKITLDQMQSSSPSYLLLASLDAARAHAQLPGTFQEPVQAAELAKKLLSGLSGITLLGQHVRVGEDTSCGDACMRAP